jgi:hypothetical protein
VVEHQKFVIVSLPRTGSTYLVDFLDAVDDVRCLSEIFHPGEIDLRHLQPADPELREMAVRDADQLGFLERVAAEISDRRWFGFKHFPRYGIPLMRLLCASPDWRKIFLWRENLLEQYLSHLLASAHFGGTGWGRVPDGQKVTIPLDMLLDDLHTMEQNYFEIERALQMDRGHVFSLEYEDLGRAEVLRAMLAFLGLPDASIDRAVSRASAAAPGDSLRFERGPRAEQRMQNADQIREHLRHTRYRRWL